MFARALTAAAIVLLPAVSLPQALAALPAGANYRNATGSVSLLVSRSSSRGYVNARTACGRLADRRVTIRGTRIRSVSASRLRVSGSVGSQSIRLRVRKGTCSRSYVLKRYSE